MKARSSCHACRRRHRKCITRPGAKRCSGCEEIDRDCEFSPKFLFQSPKQSNVRKKKSSEFRSCVLRAQDITWPPVDVATRASTVDEPLSTVATVDTPKNVGDGPCSLSREDSSSRISSEASPRLDNLVSVSSANAHSPASPQRPGLWTTGLVVSESAGSPIYTRETLESASLNSPETRSLPALTRREAFLFKTWIQRISLISDGVDEARHFGVVVPRLALEHPIVLYGILALSSRMDALSTGNNSDLECTYYHSKCIKLLIEALSRPAETYDSTLLTAVIISRLYEENDTQTNTLTYHLSGTRNLLSNDVITRLAKEGGLAEAACWIHLRQAIYISIVHRQHLEIPLCVFKSLTNFRRTDETSYANWAVYNFAQILQEFFPHPCKPRSSPQEEAWEQIENELDMWSRMRPSTFVPYYLEPASNELGKPFPGMWMASMAPAVAMQYYYAGLIIVCLKKCNDLSTNNGFEAARSRRYNENSVASYLCTIMGLALSNEHALNTWYLPCHMLDLCGYCIRCPVERAHTIQYLNSSREQIQWKAAPIIEALHQQWNELDSLEPGDK